MNKTHTTSFSISTDEKSISVINKTGDTFELELEKLEHAGLMEQADLLLRKNK